MLTKGAYSKIVVAFVIVANCIFAAACLYIFYKKGLEPIALIGAWFAFTTGELLLSAFIKKDKLKNEKDEKEGGEE